MEDYVQKIVAEFKTMKCNYFINIPEKIQLKVLEIILKRIDTFDDRRNFFPILIDGKEVAATSIRIEKGISNLQRGTLKIDVQPTEEERRCLDLRYGKLLQNVSKEELIDFKKNIFSLERGTAETNFKYVKEQLIDYYLLHYLLVKSIETNEKLNLNEAKEILKYYEMFNCIEIDVEKLLAEISPCIYNLDDLYEKLSNRKGNESYSYFLKSGEYIADFLLQERINFFMFNQRNKTFIFNFLCSDDCCHTKVGNFFLESGHDVNFINCDQKVLK